MCVCVCVGLGGVFFRGGEGLSWSFKCKSATTEQVATPFATMLAAKRWSETSRIGI